jgi:hypothetical protein
MSDKGLSVRAETHSRNFGENHSIFLDWYPGSEKNPEAAKMAT